MNTQDTFTFKVISLGSYFQDCDNGNVINRPFVQCGEIKKWGNDFIMITENLAGIELDGKTFVGKFKISKNNKNKVPMKSIMLFKECEVPNNPDYYIVKLRNVGCKFDRKFDIIKYDKESYSQIFSSAYHPVAPDEYETESILVLQHGDEIVINDRYYKFNAKKLDIEKI
jgi:hypothetical protein